MLFRKTYNGFKNSETWAAAVHITLNDFVLSRAKGLSGKALEDYMHYLDDFEINASDMISAIGDLFKVDWNEVSEAIAK